MLCANNLPYIWLLVGGIFTFCTSVMSDKAIMSSIFIELWNSSLHKLWKEICPPFKAPCIETDYFR